MLSKEEVYEKEMRRLRFERKFPRVVRVIEPQGCLSRECVQMCKCSKKESCLLADYANIYLIN